MIDFNEIWDNDGFLSSCSRADAEHFYNAGQQAKIDELKKKFVRHRNENTWSCDAIDDIYKAMIGAADEIN